MKALQYENGQGDIVLKIRDQLFTIGIVGILQIGNYVKGFYPICKGTTILSNLFVSSSYTCLITGNAVAALRSTLFW